MFENAVPAGVVSGVPSGNTALGAIDQSSTRMSFWQNHGSGWANQFNIYKGYQESSNQLRAPIYYDSNDTNYYVNPADSSRMNQIDISSAGATGLLITHTDIRSAATSTWTGNPGGAGKIQYHSNRWYIVADSSSNRIVQFRRDGTDVSYIDNAGRYIGDVQASTDVRAPIFYDTDDTNYYTNPAGTSIVKYLGRKAHQEGLMVGGYNNIGASHAKTNPIFTIGSSYLPNETTLGNMYGIGYTRGDMSGMPGTDGWGMYVAADGDARIFLDGQNGGVGTAQNSWRAPIFYDSDNTGYYTNPAGASKMNALKLEPGSGNNVSGDDNVLWIHRENNNDWGIQINADQGTATDYGYEFLGGSSHTYAFSGVAAGTRYFQIGSSFGQHSGSFRAPIFYDSDDTNHYLDPAGTSNVNTIKFSGSSNNGRFDADEWGTRHKTDSGYILLGPANTSHAHIYTDRSNFYFNAQIQLLGGSLINQNDIRAQIFYDLNDTNYYSNPAGTSLTNVTSANNFSVVAGNDNGIGFWGGTSGGSGTYAIYMSAHNGSNAGRVAGETTSDYNMYFKMGAGTNRGFAFKSGSTVHSHIDASGNIRTIADVIAFSTSDKNFKDELSVIENPLDKINNINGYNFTWNDKQTTYESGTKDIGVVAQEIEKVLPEIVNTRENGSKAVKYEKIVPLLIEGIKELKQEIDELKKQIK